VRWFAAGEHCADPRSGDVLLVDHGTWADDAIKLGQEALCASEPDLKGFTWCAHTALVRCDGPEPMVSEMGFRGFERRPLLDYKHHEYAVATFSISGEQRTTELANDAACQGLEYGWLEYPALELDGLTGAKLACSWGDAIICSHHVTLCMMGAGLFPDRPPSQIVPARIALWVSAPARASN
jgi:hypothetical protein